MDISKAFDCLHHCLKICKLHVCGFSKDVCTLFASYLYERKQRVKIGEVKNGWKEIYKGVPQGSILGPLIFNLFTNDLFYFVKQRNLFSYTDDSSVSVNHMELPVVNRLLQAEAKVTVKWFLKTQCKQTLPNLKVSYQKETNMLPHFKVTIRRQDIDFSASITALAISIDENSTFDIHVNNISLKASRQISALQRLTGLLDLPSRKAICNSFIFSKFNYCPLVYFCEQGQY